MGSAVSWEGQTPQTPDKSSTVGIGWGTKKGSGGRSSDVLLQWRWQAYTLHANDKGVDGTGIYGRFAPPQPTRGSEARCKLAHPKEWGGFRVRAQAENGFWF